MSGGGGPTDDQHAFVRDVLGADPAGYAPPADAGGQPAATDAAAPTITSQTEATSPADRARTRIGVGERVTLTVAPGPADWKVEGAQLSAGTGTQVTLIAPGKAGPITISATVGGKVSVIRFTVVAPSSVVMSAGRTQHDNLGEPNGGFFADWYIGPDDVSFAKITVLERNVTAKGTGVWKPMDGKGHDPVTTPIALTDTVVSGKGTKGSEQDDVWSGAFHEAHGPDWSGEYSWEIPWLYQCNGVQGTIATVVERFVTTADGTTTASKGGASASFALS